MHDFIFHGSLDFDNTPILFGFYGGRVSYRKSLGLKIMQVVVTIWAFEANIIL